MPNPNSELGFINTKIGFKGPNIQMMVDNGSTHSIICAETWEKIPNKERYEIAEGETNFIGTTEESVRGLKRVIVPFEFTDEEDEKHRMVYQFYIVEGKLPHQAYLGRDWLQTSVFCKGILPNHLIIKDTIEGLERKILINSISNSKYMNSINLMVVQDTMILPNKTVRIATYPEKEIEGSDYFIVDQLFGRIDSEDEMEGYEQNKMDYNVFPCMLNRSPKNEYHIYITNNSDKGICLKEGTPIAEANHPSPSTNFMHVAFSINEEDSQEATATKENCFMSSWSQ